MQAWRKKLILGAARRPFHILAFFLAFFTFLGVLFAVLITGGRPVDTVNIPAGRELEQLIADALGPTGYIYFMSVAPCVVVALLFAPLYYLFVRIGARHIREMDAAAALPSPYD